MVGWISFAFAGLKGFPFWYGGFVLCFWFAFGLLNYPQKTSLWLLTNRRVPFLLFFGALAGVLVLLDQFALNARLWYYPIYRGWWFLWVYLVLYPVSALGQLELFHFLARFFRERLLFKHRKESAGHRALDVAEALAFLAMVGLIALSAAGVATVPNVLFLVALLWLLLATVKLAFHITHATHYLLILVVVGIIAALLNEFPSTVAFEWVYLEAPLLMFVFLGVPLWVWLGWYWYAVLTLRLWIFLVLHPKVR